MMDELLSMADAGNVDGLMVGLGCAAKAGVVLASAGLLAYGLKGRAASTRHMAWSIGLAGALVLPLLVLTLPGWRVPILSAASAPEPRTSPTLEVSQRENSKAVLPLLAMKESPGDGVERSEAPYQPTSTKTIAEPTSGRSGAPAWPLMIWGAGTAAVLAWALLGWVTIWRLGRASEPITEGCWVEAVRDAAERLGVAGRVSLRRGGSAAMPLTWGIFRPVLLVPAEADEWSDDRRRAVLLHELAHVRRRDCLTQWLGLAACAAYWFNPLAWWASSRLLVERELACDDLVLEAGERPSEYAAQLLGVARSLRPAPSRGPAVIGMAMARPSGLERRLVAILDVGRNRRGPARWLVAVCLLVVLGTSATLAAVRLVTREPAASVVEGLVVGSDGKPLAGAEVFVVLSRLSVHGRMEEAPAAKVLGQSQSDARGRYRIEVADDIEMSSGRLRLIASARGFGFAASTLADLEEPAEQPIRLEPELPVVVRLVDLEGSPLADKKVQLRFTYPTAGGEGLDHDLLAPEVMSALAGGWTTDSDGRFTLRGINAGYSVGIEVRAAGFGDQLLSLTTAANVRHLTLSVARAHRIEGRVTLGKGGPPAVGAHVVARSMSGIEGMGQTMGVAKATTAADGRYQLDAAPGGSVRVVVDPPQEGAGAASAYLLRGSLVVPGDAVSSFADFALPRGVLVRGRVTEAGTNKPVVGAVVTHQAHAQNNPDFVKGNASWLNGDEQFAVTAADGTFQLGVMPGPGYLLVKAATADYLREELSSVEMYGQLIWPNRRNYPHALRKLETKPGDGPVNVDLVLRRGVTASGHLVDPGGQPVRHAVLFSRWHLSVGRMNLDSGENLKPTRGGRFELTSCDPRSSAPIFFLDAKRQLGTVMELSGKQVGKDLEVTLQPCGSATVRFLDAQHKPLKGDLSPAHLDVVLTPGASFADLANEIGKDDGKSPLMADTIMGAQFDLERYRNLKTDAEGRITFPTLIPGATYRVVVFNQPVKTQLEFTVKPGEARDLGDLVISNIDHAG